MQQWSWVTICDTIVNLVIESSRDSACALVCYNTKTEIETEYQFVTHIGPTGLIIDLSLWWEMSTSSGFMPTEFSPQDDLFSQCTHSHKKKFGIYLNIWDQIYLDCAHILFGPMVFIFLLNLQKKLFAPVSVLFPYYILSTLVSHTKDVGMTIERCWSSLWWWCQQIKVLSFSFVNASSLRRTNFPLFCSGQWSMLMHNISVKNLSILVKWKQR